MFLSKNSKLFLSKKDKRRLLGLVHNTDWSDEDSVWECGVELGKFSVMLRGEVLRRAEFGEWCFFFKSLILELIMYEWE